MDYYEIGQRIRKARKARGLSQEELAEKAGISTTHMSHIETGNTKLSLPVLVALAQELQVPTDQFLFGTARHDRAEEIANLLEGCSQRQLAALCEIVRSAKKALQDYDRQS